ncbi:MULTISPECIES: hypothetical protein [unclassified Methylobacterium]|jgi:hypothetical protein|uniref:hypothetical protein n=1 Tax=unclassified Methylobacterium TaxID=2615210 RepID=UPI0013545D5B|nr:hypothetical protein [Methylobacterium sp. 2A]MWV23509.1 hypothetical protein [Methylobacterium sp. 2A]
MHDIHAPGGAHPFARPAYRPTAVHVQVSGPRPSDPDWRLRGIGPGGAGHAHLWTSGALADLIMDAAGFLPPAEPDGGHSLAVFASGDGGGGIILRLVPQHELLAEQDAADRATRAALIATGDLDRQRALADPVRARRLMVLHDDGPVGDSPEPLLRDLEAKGITVVSRVRIDPEDLGSLQAALEVVRDHVTWCRPDVVVVACDRERRGLPVRALSDSQILAELARLPVPVATLAGSRGALIDAVAWRVFADVDDLDAFVMALLAHELRLAEPDRLETIADLLTAPAATDAA